MRGKRLIIKTLLVLSLLTVPVYAEPLPRFEFETIIITADAYRPAIDTESINVKVVNPGKAASVPEILRQEAGIDVQMRSATGDNQDGTVKLRGFDARRYSVLVDGHPVNMSGVMGGSYMDWNTIPLAAVERIEIIKGAKAGAYGNTLGGVINIITKQHAENGGNVSVMFGSNGQYQRLFNYGGNDQKVDWNVFYNQSGSDAVLKNNDYDADQYGLGLKYAFTNRDSVKFDLRHTKAKRGMIVANVPGTPGYDPGYPTIGANDAEGFYDQPDTVTTNPGAYWKKYTTYYDITWNHQTDTGSVALNYWNNKEKRHEVNFSATGVIDLDQTIIVDRSQGWQLSGTTTADKHTYSYGIDYKELRYGYGWRSVGEAADIYPSQKVNLMGTYLDDTWNLNDRWTGNLGLRYDKMSGRPDDSRATDVHRVDYDSVSPKVNFSFKNNKTTTTFLSVNRLWRAPSMAEFYWWSMPYFGNMKIGTDRQLEPEKGWGYEVGVEHKVSPALTTKLAAYYQNIDDYINFTHQWPFSCYNIDNAKLWGFEWENIYKINDISRILFSYTNQHTRKTGVAAADDLGLAGELDYRPEHKASIAYQYDGKPWKMRYSLEYTGRQTANYPYGSGSIVHIGGYVVHNLSLIHDIGKDSNVTFNIDNIFDKDYVEQYPYPMSGRTFSVSYNQKI